MAEVLLMDEAVEDLEGLDGASRRAVFRKLLELQDDPEQRGQPLGSNLGGNLTGYRKIKCGRKQSLRIVFRIEADGTIAVVTVIAKRADDEVYQTAVARLQLHDDEDIRELARPLSELFTD